MNDIPINPKNHIAWINRAEILGWEPVIGPILKKLRENNINWGEQTHNSLLAWALLAEERNPIANLGEPLEETLARILDQESNLSELSLEIEKEKGKHTESETEIWNTAHALVFGPIEAVQKLIIETEPEGIKIINHIVVVEMESDYLLIHEGACYKSEQEPESNENIEVILDRAEPLEEKNGEIMINLIEILNSRI